MTLLKPLILAAALTVAALAGAPAPADAAASPTNVVASNWAFTPNVLHVHVGDVVTLRLTSSAGVHGIKSDELGVSNTVIAPSKSIDVTFTPKKTGTFVVPCSIPCGSGHLTMKLTVIVDP